MGGGGKAVKSSLLVEEPGRHRGDGRRQRASKKGDRASWVLSDLVNNLTVGRTQAQRV